MTPQRLGAGSPTADLRKRIGWLAPTALRPGLNASHTHSRNWVQPPWSPAGMARFRTWNSALGGLRPPLCHGAKGRAIRGRNRSTARHEYIRSGPKRAIYLAREWRAAR